MGAVFTDRFTIHTSPPYNFDLSASIFAGGDPAYSRYENGSYRQVLRLGEGLAFASVQSAGTVDAPVLEIGLSSDRRVRRPRRDEAARLLSWIFHLDLDLLPFYSDILGDPVLSAIGKELRGLKSPRTPSVFEALVDSIIEQQISLDAAHAMQKRMILKYGDPIEIEGSVRFAFPSPERLSAATTEGLRLCGLSMMKSAYIISISKAIADRTFDIDSLSKMSGTAGMIAMLRNLKGVGTWTAELTLLRGLGRLDAFPADDLGLRRIISHRYFDGKPVTGEEARAVAERWGNWKGLAAFYLIMAERSEKAEKIAIRSKGSGRGKR
jgi:DNA-3-methyladenine glycosylase II